MTRAPRANSDATATMTNAARVQTMKAYSEGKLDQGRSPVAISPAATTPAAASGRTMFFRTDRSEPVRQASNGPMPVSSIRNMPIGTITRL